MRLNKLIAGYSGYARRKVDELIAQGRVEVNGKLAQLGQDVDESIDTILIDKKPLTTKKMPPIYILLNKPKNVLSSVSDDRGRTTVIDLINFPERIFPVGRLDYDTTGLILLTNDGNLALKMTHPRFHISKTYELTLKNQILAEHVHQLETGIVIDGKKTAPAQASVLSSSVVQLTLFEGRKHQVKRMCLAIGLKLVALKRVAIGPISIGNLQEGQYRPLTNSELNQLKETILKEQSKRIE